VPGACLVVETKILTSNSKNLDNSSILCVLAYWAINQSYFLTWPKQGTASYFKDHKVKIACTV